ncbi:MAG: SRPBCC family protein [Ilumatobacter sp.]|uniref:SRPBCC family protein n=1 Tax=Ilumatobacter sp. TaxID=1967498 RepID=UPI00262EA656|nr:SRPBCC family protein [Ilumatobacter sp.]MDJ0768986.1 SRPBCC family protein [Ilumatobacter sp.]
MTTVERAAHLDAPPAEVWGVLADFAAISSWAPNVDHSCLLTHQADGVGAVRRIQSGRITLVETVTVWEHERAIGYTIDGLPPRIRSVINTWRLSPSGSGTAVRLTSEVDAGPRPPQQLLARAVGRRLARASDQMLTGLAVRVAGVAGRSAATGSAP